MSGETGGCPDDADLAAVLLGEASEARRDEIAEHALGCRRCADSFRLLAAVHEQTRGLGAARRPRLLSLATVAAAGVIVVALGAYALLHDASHPSPGALRGGVAVVVEPENGAVLNAPPIRLAWPAQAGATGYRVRLFGADGARIWTSAVLGADVTAVPLLSGRMAPGSFRWTVEVEGPVRRSRLGPFTFVVPLP